MEKIFSLLRRTMPELELRQNEPLSAHTSFRIGGVCSVMALPDNERELVALAGTLRGLGREPLVMGRGTNLLFAEGPLDLAVIKLGDDFSEISGMGENRLYAQAGASLARLACFARDLGLSGLEFAHGIPGAVGGAVVMNAGAYGGEMKDVVRRVRVLDADGSIREIPAADCGFAYRHSIFPDSGMIILGCELELKPGSPGEISAAMRNLAQRRRDSQPLDKPSAGSAFKRPASGYAAALIEQSGLKGFRAGGAAVSDKHAGFIVNLGDATFEDVSAVIEHVRRTVLEKTGVELIPEIKIITQ